MVKVKVLGDVEPIPDVELARQHLNTIGISYERYELGHRILAEHGPTEILNEFSKEIEHLKTQNGYTTADVIDVSPSTPGLEEMLERFRREHWHDEDEVRLVLRGRGAFYIHNPQGSITEIEVEQGDMITVPRGTHHWFDLCAERSITAIRLFQDQSGWVPHYVPET